MDRFLAERLTDFSMYSVIIPTIIVFIKFRFGNDTQKWISVLVLITLLGEVLLNVLVRYYDNNLPVLHFFTVCQFVLFVLIFEKALIPLFPPVFFKSLIIGFLIFAFFDAFLFNGLKNFNSNSRPLSSFILIFLALSFFYKTLKELKIKYLEKEPVLWLSIGVILYFSGSLFIFIFTNYVRNSNEVLLTLWGIHAIFNIVLNLSYSAALWVKPTH